MTDKPHKGEIHDWWREGFDTDAAREQYEEDIGLGFVIRGVVLNHPNFGNTSGGFFHTSWVVKYDEVTKEIETRNSRYTLVGPEHGTTVIGVRDGKLK